MDPRVPPDLHELAAEAKDRRVKLCLDLLERRLNGVTVVAEAVHRRHNISAILRSAEAFGMHEAHLVAEHWRPSVGAAKGAERWLDLEFHESIDSCFAQLRERGHVIYVADLDEHAIPPEELPVDQPIAVLFGSELGGVSPRARELADGVVTVPMHGVTQSLNVSVAAALTLYALCERRRQVPGAVGLDEATKHAFLKRFLLREKKRKRPTGVLYRED
ncbi:MAG: RNA methyltransferase [Proteobacteria bacterium]|nr:RNA methyltransferase [Pseudomonadota bacterium]MCP4920450.1 RNA methyltransferase [Pseudomonadota bacterium]